MNEIIKAMEERRSIRKFKPDMPAKQDLEQIIEAGLYAANGMGQQATITIAVTNKELRDELSEINRKIGGWDEGFDPFYGAPAILLVLANKERSTYVYDGSLVMGNMLRMGRNCPLCCRIYRRRTAAGSRQKRRKSILD